MKIALKIITGGSLVVALAGCTVQNLPNGGVTLNPIPMGQIFDNGQSHGLLGSTPFPTQIGVPQNYAGYLEGGNGSMTITKKSPGTYFVSLEVQNPATGFGQVEGYAYRRGNSLVMTRGFDGSPSTMGTCDISFTPRGNRISVFEQSCMAFHGAEVSFNGDVSKVGG